MKSDSVGFYKNKYKTISFILTALAGIWSDLRISWIFTSALRLVILLLSLFYTAAALLFQLYSQNSGACFPHYAAAVMLSGLYVAFLIFHLCGLLVFDLVRLLTGGIIRGKNWSRALSSAAAVTGIGVTEYGRRHAQTLKTVKYSARMEKLPPGEKYRIVQLSDLHIGAIIGKDYIRRVVQKVNAEQPDAVVITGDIFNHSTAREITDYRDIFEELAGIQAPDGIFAVRGNHDPEKNSRAWQEFLSASHAIDLDNRSAGAGPVSLVGRPGLCGWPERMPLRKLTDSCDPGKPVVVLDHDPNGMEEARNLEADLVLSGHTHNGQFFPCNYFTRFWYGKERCHGKHAEGGTLCITSAGTGFFQTPVRIGTDSEIVVADLTGTGDRTPAGKQEHAV
ncbi:MAG: metallophosphoesterase [Bilifractor sp.]